jgi:cytochrome c556
LGAGRKAQSASKIWEKMQQFERKAQMHDAKVEYICSKRMGAKHKFQA